MRKRISYANVAATLALVLSMSGGALAAGHYLISSTKQISPKVLKKLKGAPGPTGKEGATGKEGVAGKEGPAGKEGTTGKEGPGGIGPAFSAFHNTTMALEPFGGLKPVLTLANVPAGSYWVMATFDAFNGNSSGTHQVTMECALKAEGDTDTNHFKLGDNREAEDSAVTVAMQVVHHFGGASNAVVLECNDFVVPNISIDNAKITAVQVSSVTNTEV